MGRVSLLLLSDDELLAPFRGMFDPALLLGTTTAGGPDREVEVLPKSFILLVLTTLLFLTRAGSFPVECKVVLGFGTSSFLIPRASLLTRPVGRIWRLFAEPPP